MGDTKKNLRPLGHLEALPLAPLKMVLAPLQVKKKIVRILGFMVFKSTGSNSRFQHMVSFSTRQRQEPSFNVEND